MTAREISKAVHDMENKFYSLEHELSVTKIIAYRLLNGDFENALSDDEKEFVKSHSLLLSKKDNKPFWLEK